VNTPQVIDERKGGTSASAAYADLLCPGRHLAQRGQPDHKGPEAESGNRVHAALAGGDIPVDPKERDVVEVCQRIESDLVAQFFPGEADRKVIREQRFYVQVPYGTAEAKEPAGYYLHSAKPDVVYRTVNRALILEYKSLSGEVQDSQSNLQLRDQAVIAGGSLMIVGDIGVAVIQPLFTHKPDITVYTASDRRRAETEMFDRIRRSNDPSSPRIPGERQCKYCRARLLCVEHQKWAASMVPAVLTVLDVPLAQWTPEQRALFCEREPVARAWLEHAKEAMEAGLERDPNFVPGFCMKPNSPTETIVKAQETFDRFIAVGGKPEQFMPCVKVQKTPLKAAVGSVLGKKGKALDAAMSEMLSGLTETKPRKATLTKKEEA